MPFVPNPSFVSAFVLVCVFIVCASPILLLIFCISVARSLRRITHALESLPAVRLEVGNAASPAPSILVAERHGRMVLSQFGR